MTEGELEHDESIECTGHYFPNEKNYAKCWTYTPKSGYSTHGKLRAVQALARSCNIFFYELGTRLGFDRLVHWLQLFGMSQPLAAQLTRPDAEGKQGHLHSQAKIQILKDRGAIAFETVSISIGQGALTWSPLHVAAAYATLARGGMWRSPRLIQGKSQSTSNLHLNQEGVRMALEGMRESVTKEYGTGSRLNINGKYEPTFNVQGVKIWGKTGTAQAPPYQIDNDSKPIEDGRHAWFVVLASSLGKSTPSVVVVVLVEVGGSGGLAAGPIANQALHALAAEGYFK
jgi:penicillin-binding protein 2